MTGKTAVNLAVRGCALVGLVALLLGASGANKDALGPLVLDPQGADFAAWISHFKGELYKHWPPAKGVAAHRGRVVLEFTVAHDGTLGHVRKKRGEKTLGSAAEAALRACAFEPLPAEYKAAEITMSLVFRVHLKPSVGTPSPPPR